MVATNFSDAHDLLDSPSAQPSGDTASLRGRSFPGCCSPADEPLIHELDQQQPLASCLRGRSLPGCCSPADRPLIHEAHESSRASARYDARLHAIVLNREVWEGLRASGSDDAAKRENQPVQCAPPAVRRRIWPWRSSRAPPPPPNGQAPQEFQSGSNSSRSQSSGISSGSEAQGCDSGRADGRSSSGAQGCSGCNSGRTNGSRIDSAPWPSIARPVRSDGVLCSTRLDWMAHTLGHEMLHVALWTLCARGEQWRPGVWADEGHGPTFQRLNWHLFGHTDHEFAVEGWKSVARPVPVRQA